MPRYAIAIAALLVSACATPVTMLRNDQGQIARCGGGTGGSMAGGVVGYSIEQNSDAQCVADFEARGFKRQ